MIIHAWPVNVLVTRYLRVHRSHHADHSRKLLMAKKPLQNLRAAPQMRETVGSASPSQPENNHVGLITAVIGFLSAGLSLFGRRKLASSKDNTGELDRLSRLERRFDAMEARQDEQAKVAAEIHREIFELLRSSPRPKDAS